MARVEDGHAPQNEHQGENKTGLSRVELSYVDPALRQTALWLKQNGVDEDERCDRLYDIWNFQGYTLPRLTGEDLAVGIAGGKGEDNSIGLTYFVPSPQGEELTRRIREEFEYEQDHFEEDRFAAYESPSKGKNYKIKGNSSGEGLPDDLQRINAVYTRASLSVIPSSADAFAESIAQQSKEKGLELVGICLFDVRSELEQLFHEGYFRYGSNGDVDSFDQWLSEPSSITGYQKSIMECFGMPQEMLLRDVVFSVKYPQAS